MSSHRDRDRDGERLVRQFFADVHVDDRPPSFQRLASLLPAEPRRQRVVWRPVFAMLTVVAMAVGVFWLMPGLRGPGVAPLSDDEQLALALELSRWEAPLDFLLETPGRELLLAPPSFELLRLMMPPPADREETRP